MVDENQKPIIGEPLPEKLSSIHKAAHFMTLDKIVAKMSMSDAEMNGSYFGNLEREHVNKMIGKNQKMFISDFDEFMPNGNPIVI